MDLKDAEMSSFEEEFFKRLSIAHRIIESRNDPTFTHWANVLLSETLVISIDMVSQITRVSPKELHSRARILFPYNSWRTTIPVSYIPKMTERSSVASLFWYSTDDTLYSLPNSELPQYLYFLTRKLNAPDKHGQEGLMNISEINKLLPTKWREYL